MENAPGTESAEAAPAAPETPAEAPTPAPAVTVTRRDSTPIEGRAPTLRIRRPRDGANLYGEGVVLDLRLAGWELAPDPGNHVHVIVDNEPYIAVRDVSRPINLTTLVKEKLGHDLAAGTHVVRVFPSRGQHESVKTARAFAMITFHVSAPSEGHSFDARAPLLTFSRPKGCYVTGTDVLLDFYVSNVELSPTGHRVRYTIDAATGELTEWTPYNISNLAVGDHTIRLELLGPDGQPVAGLFNDTTRTIQVAPTCP